jgi:hypothetical protein
MRECQRSLVGATSNHVKKIHSRDPKSFLCLSSSNLELSYVFHVNLHPLNASAGFHGSSIVEIDVRSALSYAVGPALQTTSTRLLGS